MRLNPIFPLVLCLAVPFPWAHADTTLDATSFTEEGMEKVVAEFKTVRLERDDFKLSRGWPLKFTIGAVESFFSKPFTLPSQSTKWANQMEAATTSSDVFDVAAVLLKSSTTKAALTNRKKVPAFPSKMPPALKPLLKRFYHALEQAQSQLNEAIDSVPPSDREDYLTLYGWPKKGTDVIVQDISSRRIERKFNGMEPYRQSEMIQAGALLFRELDILLPQLESIKDLKLSGTLRWKTPLGVILISSQDDTTYKEDDLKEVILLIDLGGDNLYETPVAAALDKEIRIAIDLGRNVTIQSKNGSGPNAGAGIFGIGILLLPNQDGLKKIDVDSFGQGCGMGGIGALILQGQAHLSGVRYVQGAGVFGVGLLRAINGHQSTYRAERNGQGLGMTRGVGLFHHRGDDVDIQGGLIQPDPREPQGSVSLCQGVGFGRRAYSGGGVGIAVVEGDRASVKGSYFSQGCGYWHALGIFRHRGNNSVLQARRYDFGSGVHSAFGHFQLFGNNNRLFNWGGGPANGWDNSIGSALIRGSDNEIQAKWGTGTAKINSLSYSFIQGDRNRFKLRSYGSGAYFRRQPAYSVHLLEGEKNELIISRGNLKESDPVRIMYNPWGVFRINAPTLNENLKFSEPIWPKLQQEKIRSREQLDLQAHIKASETKQGEDKVADLIDVASAFSLDKESPKEAFRRLLDLSPDDVPDLVDVFNPVAVDQTIYLWPIMASYGDPLTQIILDRFDSYSAHKKASLLNQLSYHRPSLILPRLFSLIENKTSSDETTSMRIAALGTVGQILNLDSGQEPGRRAVLMAMNSFLQAPKSKKARTALAGLLSRIRPPEAFGLLTLARPTTGDIRLAFYGTFTDDITNVIDKKGAEKFIELIETDREACAERVQKGLEDLAQAEEKTRRELARLLQSRKTSEIKAALLNLGRIANSEDLDLIKPFLSHSSGTLREVTAVGLGRMGDAAIPFMKEVMASGSISERKTIMAAGPHGVTKKIISILKMGLDDPNPLVQLTATSAIHASSPIINPFREKLIRKVRKKFKKSSDASLRVAGPVF